MSNNLSPPTRSAGKCCYDKLVLPVIRVLKAGRIQSSDDWWSESEVGQICTLKTAYKKYDKIFKYLNQDIRGNCYKQSNVVMITHLRKQVKTNLEPTHVTLYMCGWERNSRRYAFQAGYLVNKFTRYPLLRKCVPVASKPYGSKLSTARVTCHPLSKLVGYANKSAGWMPWH